MVRNQNLNRKVVLIVLKKIADHCIFSVHVTVLICYCSAQCTCKQAFLLRFYGIIPTRAPRFPAYFYIDYVCKIGLPFPLVKPMEGGGGAYLFPTKVL